MEKLWSVPYLSPNKTDQELFSDCALSVLKRAPIIGVWPKMGSNSILELLNLYQLSAQSHFR